MVRSCPVMLVAALTGFRAMCALLRSRGYAVCWRDSLGATVYDKAGHASHWRLVRDDDVVVQSESAAWDVAITWSLACSMAGPRPEVVGRAVPVSVLDPVERGVCADVVLSVAPHHPCKLPS